MKASSNHNNSPKQLPVEPQDSAARMHVVKSQVNRKAPGKVRRLFLITGGGISLIFGIAGIVVPLLPATPFLLLSSWCFVRSSPKLNQKLMNNRYFGPYIRNYREKRGITRRHKIHSLLFLWVTLLTSFIFSPPVWWIWLILAAVGTGVTYHILRFKTLKE